MHYLTLNAELESRIKLILFSFTHILLPFSMNILDLLTFVKRVFICPLTVKNIPWSNLQNVKEYAFVNELC